MGLSESVELPLTGERQRIDRELGVLSGSRCSTCGANAWPARAVCHGCGNATMQAISFAPTGRLLTYTTVWVERPNLPSPYTLGQIKIDSGPLVFGHVRSDLSDVTVPTAVRIVLSPDADAVPPFWFELEEVG